jgi:TRAP-type transport system periplasmic protein
LRNAGKGALLWTMVALWGSCMAVHAPDAKAGPQYSIKFATVAPEGSTWIKHMRALDQDIRARSGGKIEFRIYPGGVAGDELDVLKKIRIGQIHCAAFSGVGFGQILPAVRVLDLPYLFRNSDEVDRVHKELRPYFGPMFGENGFELLSWAEVGDVHLFSKKAIEKVSDFTGLKVWTWSGDPIAKQTFTDFGTTPIPLALTDVLTAVNTGMIDTLYAPPLGALALQWHTHLRFLMAMPLVHSTGAVLISSAYYSKLPPDLAKLLSDRMESAMAELTTDLRKQSVEATRIIRESGLTLVPPPQKTEMDAFYAVGDRVARELTGSLYSKKVLEKVYGILNRSR